MSFAVEQHYTVQEVAKLWGWSENTVRRELSDYPGVLKTGGGPRLSGKGRSRVMLRFPASVLERFHEERSRGFGSKVERRRG